MENRALLLVLGLMLTFAGSAGAQDSPAGAEPEAVDAEPDAPAVVDEAGDAPVTPSPSPRVDEKPAEQKTESKTKKAPAEDDDSFAWGTYLAGVGTGVCGCCASVVITYACGFCSVLGIYAVGGAALFGLLSLGNLGGAMAVLAGTSLLATGAGGAVGTALLASSHGVDAPEVMALGAASGVSMIAGVGLTALGASTLFVVLDDERRDEATAFASSSWTQLQGAAKGTLSNDHSMPVSETGPREATASDAARF